MKNLKRIVAIICIIILLGLYVVTFIMSIVDNSASMTLFKGCIATTIFIPIAAYCYICLHKYAMNRSKRKDYYSKDYNLPSDSDSSSDSNP